MEKRILTAKYANKIQDNLILFAYFAVKNSDPCGHSVCGHGNGEGNSNPTPMPECKECFTTCRYRSLLAILRAVPPHPVPLPWGERTGFSTVEHFHIAVVIQRARRFSLSPRERGTSLPSRKRPHRSVTASNADQEFSPAVSPWFHRHRSRACPCDSGFAFSRLGPEGFDPFQI